MDWLIVISVFDYKATLIKDYNNETYDTTKIRH